MAKVAFLFPGQGAQTVGMCRDVAATVPAAKRLFDRASSVLGYDLLDVCTNGPPDRLNATVISQPALFVAGLAAVEKLKHESCDAINQCQSAAGLSLGEYTALVFAGAMSFEDGLRVVQVRGESMQAAADATPSTMTSVLGLESEKLQALCDAAAADQQVRIANYLCPGNLVVSGAKEACEALERLAPEFGAMKTIRLAVAGAFHSPIMASAQPRLADALQSTTMRMPRIAVVFNVDGLPHSDPDEIRSLLIRQVVEPVQWERSMRNMLDDGFATFYELGPGRVLAGLMKRIQRRTEVVNVTV